jgi:hypothetical protein
MVKKALLKAGLKAAKKILNPGVKVKRQKPSAFSKYYRKNIRDTGIAIGGGTLGGAGIGYKFAKDKKTQNELSKAKRDLKKSVARIKEIMKKKGKKGG